MNQQFYYIYFPEAYKVINTLKEIGQGYVCLNGELSNKEITIKRKVLEIKKTKKEVKLIKADDF